MEMNLEERVRLCGEYVDALEEERKKILVFQRELPLCLALVTHAIETGKQQIQTDDDNVDVPSNDTPVLEQFIPLKPMCSSSCSDKPLGEDDKPDWMRSVQLWNQDLDPPPIVPQKPISVNARKFGGAFRPFKKEKTIPVVVEQSAPTASSTVETVTEKEVEGQSESNRKARRCWSPELHRRFLHALQQLGGSHAATPKQIRELMKVDGLTNDEVKSHLQKYRLHTRRPSTAVQRSRSSSPRAPHFMVVGGIWLPTSDPPAADPTQPSRYVESPSRKELHSPVASLSTEHRQQKQSNRSPNRPLCSEARSSQNGSSLADNGTIHHTSPTCSSSQTVTAS